MSRLDYAIALLRRTLEIREAGIQGVHKTAIRAFIRECTSAPRFDRQREIERAIAELSPECDEAVEIVHALQEALRKRFEDKAFDVQDTFTEACAGLRELERTLSAYEGPDEMDRSRDAAIAKSEAA